ncbi:nitronate monooxygenase [Roseibium sp. SCP14]|uniref:nitronate monooxygenase n=1 Tax=Roseibium sp. SCP14 TaxID=3141375 RepID=UPI0033382092
MIDTRLTRKFGLTCPIVLAPMSHAAGGKLAAAVSAAGGLGFIGDGGGDLEWIGAQLDEAADEAIGCGFATWRLSRMPSTLDRVLKRRPKAVFLSYGDPRPFAPTIRQEGIPLVCQVHSLQEARQAVEAEADIIVAQGCAAGGYSAERSTLTLVPEVADFLYKASHETLLLAAGGVADSRGLAASIVMGADGVVMGTRLWASQEVLLTPGDAGIALNATGDDTRRIEGSGESKDTMWPEAYRLRALTDDFARHWTKEYDPASLKAPVGEAIGLVHSTPPVGEIIDTITTKAERLLTHVQRKVIH